MHVTHTAQNENERHRQHTVAEEECFKQSSCNKKDGNRKTTCIP